MPITKCPYISWLDKFGMKIVKVLWAVDESGLKDCVWASVLNLAQKFVINLVTFTVQFKTRALRVPFTFV